MERDSARTSVAHAISDVLENAKSARCGQRTPYVALQFSGNSDKVDFIRVLQPLGAGATQGGQRQCRLGQNIDVLTDFAPLDASSDLGGDAVHRQPVELAENAPKVRPLRKRLFPDQRQGPRRAYYIDQQVGHPCLSHCVFTTSGA